MPSRLIARNNYNLLQRSIRILISSMFILASLLFVRFLARYDLTLIHGIYGLFEWNLSLCIHSSLIWMSTYFVVMCCVGYCVLFILNVYSSFWTSITSHITIEACAPAIWESLILAFLLSRWCCILFFNFENPRNS